MAIGRAIAFKKAEVTAGRGLLAFMAAAGVLVAERDAEEVAEGSPKGGAEVGWEMGGFQGFEAERGIAPGEGFEPGWEKVLSGSSFHGANSSTFGLERRTGDRNCVNPTTNGRMAPSVK